MTMFRGPLHRQVQSVHLFWGALDLSVTHSGPHRARASGRHPEPARPRDPRGVFTRSQQLRFLARSAPIDYPAFYRTRPEPPGFAEARVRP